MPPAAASTQPKSQESTTKESNEMITEVTIDPDTKAFDEIRESVSLIEKGVSTKEDHYIGRAIRAILPIRHSLNPNVLRISINHYFPKDCEAKTYFMQFLPDFIETNGHTITPTKSKTYHSLSIESEVYLHLLLLIYLLDKGLEEESVRCSEILMDRLAIQQSRFLAIIAAKCYYYYSQAYEVVNRLETIRPKLHKYLRTATLHNHYEAQSSLINLLLYNYLKYHLFDQMHKLINKVNFPTSSPNSKWARYLYYQGRVKAIQLEYNQAHEHLVAAMRKAPQQTAVGFKQNLYKFTIVVELLMGEIPDRAIFRDPVYEKALMPYFELTKAIQTGNLEKFILVKDKYTNEFIKDETNSLIIRLKHNVIKAGIRKISLSYSRISLHDVAMKLHIAKEEIDHIIAKAIHDGVIDAKIDDDKQIMITNETMDLYSTMEPMNQFNDRIKFCLGVRNQAVKAMRYPPKQYHKELETAEERREREQQELETAKELTEDDFDGFS